jgi:hypothetical protein
MTRTRAIVYRYGVLISHEPVSEEPERNDDSCVLDFKN